MKVSSELINEVQREHVIAALADLDQDAQTGFADPTKFDVLYHGKRYAPKRVLGLALQKLSGQSFGPKAFEAGEDFSCFRALRRCGLTIVSKKTLPLGSLCDDFAEVLSLQTAYSSSNTLQMARRGVLIRDSIPQKLQSGLSAIESIFTDAAFSCEVKGSDGVGRKNESAWVRIYDPMMSPSATLGWYIVLHFSRTGDVMYAGVGCGATYFKNGTLLPLPVSTVSERIAWARAAAVDLKFPTEKYGTKVNLHGNNLSFQFERAMAFAKSYNPTFFEEATFWEDLAVQTRLLVGLYELERLGKEPLSDPPEVKVRIEEISKAATGKYPNKGQGRGLSAAERTAVELRAMEVAARGLMEAGFENIRDVSKTNSFDFSATRGGTEWCVEVKGTTSIVANVFLLTAPELALHRLKEGSTVLALVANINLRKGIDGPVANGGSLELHDPWKVDEWAFAPTAFRAERKN